MSILDACDQSGWRRGGPAARGSRPSSSGSRRSTARSATWKGISSTPGIQIGQRKQKIGGDGGWRCWRAGTLASPEIMAVARDEITGIEQISARWRPRLSRKGRRSIVSGPRTKQPKNGSRCRRAGPGPSPAGIPGRPRDAFAPGAAPRREPGIFCAQCGSEARVTLIL